MVVSYKKRRIAKDSNIRKRNKNTDPNSCYDSTKSDEQLDLKHLAPISIVDIQNKWPEPNYHPISMRNIKFNGKQQINDNIFSDYYKYNKNRHFAWTNQLVISKSTKVDKNVDNIDERDNWLLISPEILKKLVSNLKNPDEYFYLKRFKNIGFGLFAKHDIPKDECIGEYTGEVITKEEKTKRGVMYEEKKLGNYFYSTSVDGMKIDAQAMGNHTRFINHSCQPNVWTFGVTVDGVQRVLLMTGRKVRKDEQLFSNYGRAYFEGMRCECGTRSCFQAALDAVLGDNISSRLRSRCK